jgi:hypothetical protein
MILRDNFVTLRRELFERKLGRFAQGTSEEKLPARFGILRRFTHLEDSSIHIADDCLDVSHAWPKRIG